MNVNMFFGFLLFFVVVVVARNTHTFMWYMICGFLVVLQMNGEHSTHGWFESLIQSLRKKPIYVILSSCLLLILFFCMLIDWHAYILTDNLPLAQIAIQARCNRPVLQFQCYFICINNGIDNLLMNILRRIFIIWIYKI